MPGKWYSADLKAVATLKSPDEVRCSCSVVLILFAIYTGDRFEQN
jgi:hypothetical protein